MRIYIRSDDFNEANQLETGNQYVINVQPTDTIRSLESTIQHLFSISDEEIGERMLVHCGRDLFDEDASSTLDQCGIEDWACLSVGIKGPLTVTLQGPNYSHYTIEVSPFETFREIMARFPDSPFKLNEKDDTLISCGLFKKINHESPLCLYNDDDDEEDEIGQSFEHLCVSTRIGLPREEVLYRLGNRRGYPGSVPDKATSIMLQIAVEIPIIRLRTPFVFKSTDTIGDLRYDIQSWITKGLFVLVFNRKQLEDVSLTLDECGIKNGDSILVFEKESFEIVISAPENGLHIHVKVECFDTIAMLKEQLQVMTGIPPDRQRLLYHEWFLDDDERCLVDYGIAIELLTFGVDGKRTFRNPGEEFLIFLLASSNDSESAGESIATKAGLSLEEFRKFVLYGCLPHATIPGEDCSSVTMLQIVVEIPNMPWRFPLMCKLTDTIGTVREDIRGKCYNRYNELLSQRYIEKGMFVLHFNRKQLMDESITLDECGIKHMDSIELFEEASFPIVITVFERNLCTYVNMRCFDTIRMLKEKIEYMTGIPLEKQHLGLALVGWWLDDNDEGRRFVDYDIAKYVEYDESLVRRNCWNYLFWHCDRENIFGIYVASSKSRLIETIAMDNLTC